MFKGLKSKLAEETKRIQTAVQQVSGSLASVSSRHSEDDNDLSITGQSSFSAVDKTGSADVPGPAVIDVSSFDNTSSVATDSHNTTDGNFSLRYNTQEADNNQLSALNTTNRSSLLVESEDLVDMASPNRRQRLDSQDSTSSYDNVGFLPTFTSSLVGRVGPIPSDLESNATGDVESNVGSSYISGASKEQISSVLHKLQGRAANYKDRYRQTVLTTTQDKALRRIEQLREEKQLAEKHKKDVETSLRDKLQQQDGSIATLREQIQLLREGKPVDEEALQKAKPVGAEAASLEAEKEKVKRLEDLLNRCKESIKANKEKINQLTAENEDLNQRIVTSESDQGMGEFASERVAREWRERLEASERRWAERLTEADERGVMAVAQAKQDIHEELESKDAHAQQLLLRLRQLEARLSTDTSGLKLALEESQAALLALEQEKKDMAEHLSKAKQEAIRLLKEESLKDTEKLLAEFAATREADSEKFAAELRELEDYHNDNLKKQEELWIKQMKELEEQMQLAIEEREMQKGAAVVEHDRRNDELRTEIEQLTTEKLQIMSEFEQFRESSLSQISEMTQMVEENSKRHKDELALLQSRKSSGSELRLEEVTQQLEQAISDKETLETELSSLRKEFEMANEEFAKSANHSDSMFKEQVTILSSENSSNVQKICDLQERKDMLESENKILNTNIINLGITLEGLEQHLEEEKAKYITLHDEKVLLQVDLSNSRQEISGFNSQLTDAQSKLNLSEKKAAELNVEVLTMQKELTQKKIFESEEHLQREVNFRTNLETYSKRLSSIQEMIELQSDQLTDELSVKNSAIKNFIFRTETLKEKIESIHLMHHTQLNQFAGMLRCLKDVFFTAVVRISDFSFNNRSQETDLCVKQKAIFMQIDAKLKTLHDDINMVCAQSTDNKCTSYKDCISNNIISGEFYCSLTVLFNGIIEDIVTVFGDVYAQIVVAEQQNKVLSDTVDQHVQEIDNQSVAVLRLNEALKQKDEDGALLASLKAENGNLRAELEKVHLSEKEIRESSTFAVTEKEIQLNELRELLGILEDAVSEYHKQINEQELEKTKLKQVIQNQSADAFFNTTEHKLQMCQLSERVTELETAIESYKTKLVENSTTDQSLETKEADFACIRQNLKALLHESFFSVQEGKHQLNVEYERYQKLEEAVEALKLSLAQKQEQVNALLIDLESKNQNLYNMENQCLEVQNSNDQIEKIHNEMKAKLDKDIEHLSYELSLRDQLVTQLEEAASESKLKVKQLEEYCMVFDEKVLLVNDLSAKVSDITSCLEMSKDEISVLTKKNLDLEQLTNHKCNLEADVIQKNEEVKHLQALLMSKENELAIAIAATDALKKDVESNIESLKQLQERHSVEETVAAEKLDAKILEYKKKAEAKIQQLKKHLEKEKESVVKKLQSKILDLEHAIEEKDHRFASLHALSQTLESKISAHEVTENNLSVLSTQQAEKLNHVQLELEASEQHIQNYMKEKNQFNETISNLDTHIADELAKVNELNEHLNGLHDKLNNLQQSQMTDSEKSLILCKSEYESKIASMVEDHNNKVKTLAKEFEKTLQEKETDWQESLNSSYDQGNSEKQQLMKEYQREVKQLYKDLKDRTMKLEETKSKAEEELKVRDVMIEQLKMKVSELEARDYQQQDSSSQQTHLAEMKGLQIEWNVEQKQADLTSTSAVEGDEQFEDAFSTNEFSEPLGGQAQVEASAGSNSVSYLQRQIQKLESDIEALKQQHIKELDLLVKGAMGQSEAIRPTTSSNVSLNSVPLDYPSSPLFAEPTEAEYLRNVLYRYMVERENLGKESVVSAVIIANYVRNSGINDLALSFVLNGELKISCLQKTGWK